MTRQTGFNRFIAKPDGQALNREGMVALAAKAEWE